MRATSSTSAGAIYLDRDERLEELREAARRAASRMPAISRVVLFGSLASGRPTARSDADLVVIVDSSPHAEPRDRIPGVLAAFSPLPCPLDVFVLTREEVERHSREGSPLLRVALSTGIDLIG